MSGAVYIPSVIVGPIAGLELQMTQEAALIHIQVICIENVKEFEER